MRLIMTNNTFNNASADHGDAGNEHVKSLLDAIRAAHLDDDVLEGFVRQELGQTRVSRVRGHVRQCDECREQLVTQIEFFVQEHQPPPYDDGRSRAFNPEPLYELLAHPESLVRVAAVQAIAQLDASSQGILTSLERVARVDEDPEVRRAASLALGGDEQTAFTNTSRTEGDVPPLVAADATADALKLLSSTRFNPDSGTYSARSNAVTLVLERAPGRHNELRIALGVEGASADWHLVAVRLRHEGTQRGVVAFLDRNGEARLPIEPGLEGTFRLDTPTTSAHLNRSSDRFLGSSVRGTTAEDVGHIGPFTARVAAKSEDDVASQRSHFVAQSEDKLVTVDVTREPGGVLQMTATDVSEDKRYRDALVAARFMNAANAEVEFKDEKGVAVKIQATMRLSRAERPFGVWKKRAIVPHEADHLKVVIFARDETWRADEE
jgi:hypothetical protein